MCLLINIYTCQIILHKFFAKKMLVSAIPTNSIITNIFINLSIISFKFFFYNELMTNYAIKYTQGYETQPFNVGYLVGVAVPTSLLTSTVRGCNILPPQITYLYCTFIISFLFTFVKIFVNNFYIFIVNFLHLCKFFRNIPNYTFFISKLYYIIIFFIF